MNLLVALFAAQNRASFSRPLLVDCARGCSGKAIEREFEMCAKLIVIVSVDQQRIHVCV